jgi:hypothetical protein
VAPLQRDQSMDMYITHSYSAVSLREVIPLAICANTFCNFSQSEIHFNSVLQLANGIHVRGNSGSTLLPADH